MIKEKRYLYIFLIPTCATLAGLTLYPTAYTVYVSFHQVLLTKPYLGTPFVWFGNYLNAFAGFNIPFLESLKITLIFTFTSVAVSLGIGLGIALLLVEGNIRGKRIIQSLLLIPMVMCPVVVGFFWRFMYNETVGIIPYLLRAIGFSPQTILGKGSSALVGVILVDIWEWTPFVAIVCIAGLSALPVEPFEAAIVDGASGWKIFRYITLPMLRPVILVALLFRTMDAFRTFDSIYIMTKGGPGTATQTLTLLGYKIGFEFFDIGTSSAYAILMLILAIIFGNIYLKLIGREI